MVRPRILLCIIISIVTGSIVIGQEKTADSLKLALSKTGRDTNRINTLIALSKNCVRSSPEEAFAYGSSALQLADSLQYIKGKAYAYKYLGMYYYIKGGNNVGNLDQWLKSLNAFKSINDKQGISNILNNIGALYNDQADDAKAIDYYLQSLTIAEELGDKLRIGTVLQNIGRTYLRRPDTEIKAIQYLLRALPICEQLQDETAIATVLANLGEVYLNRGKTNAPLLDSSLFYLKKGLKVSKNSVDITTTYVLNNLGRVYAEKHNYDLAISYEKQSVDIASKLNAKQDMGKSLLYLADAYLGKGDIDMALRSYQQAEKLLLEVHSVEELVFTYKGLTQAWVKKRNFNKVFTYQTLYTDYKDSLYNIETNKKVSNLALEFNISSKEKDIKLLTKDKALSDLDLQKQKATRNALGVGVLLLLVIAFVIYRNYRIKVKTNIILDKQKVQIENLMHNILPEEVAAELQEHGKATPRHYDTASVLFTDFKSFTSLADKLTAQELIEELSDSFVAFDDIIEKNQLEKIKTIGDSYMCAGGIPSPNEGYVTNLVKAGLEMQEYIKEKNSKRAAMGLPAWELRLGIHVGPIVAGVVGKKKYAYDIWGNTVNIASRMESNGEPGRVNISASTYALIKDQYACSYRGKISAKNIGEIDMYFVDEKINKTEPEFAVTEMGNNYR